VVSHLTYVLMRGRFTVVNRQKHTPAIRVFYAQVLKFTAWILYRETLVAKEKFDEVFLTFVLLDSLVEQFCVESLIRDGTGA
jgi:hypothetical protein